MSDKPDRKRSRKRWGDASAPAPAVAATPAATATNGASTTTATKTKTAVVVDSKAKALALQASIQARLAALKAKTSGGAGAGKLPTAIPSKKAPPPSNNKNNASSSSSSLPLPPPPSSLPPPPTGGGSLKRPPPPGPIDGNGAVAPPSAKRAKVYELDLNVTGPTFKGTAAAAKPKPKINPYLAHTLQKKTTTTTATDDGEGGGNMVEGAVDDEGTADEVGDDEDERLQRATKKRLRHKPLNFIEPGLFTEIAERKRLKAANAEQSGFVSGRKTGTYVRQTKMENIYGTTDVLDDDVTIAPPPQAQDNKTTMPYVLEWWDMELLPGKLKKQVAAYEGKVMAEETQNQMTQLDATKSQTKIKNMVNPEVDGLIEKCNEHAALSYCKTAALVQHIVPIKPANATDGPKVEPTLYLTKRELKRQRKLRREEKQKNMQDLQAAGLMPAPEPRLTLQNFIRVLGDQAYVDPSQMEQKVMEQVQARQRAHLERNAKNKLTKAQRAEKRARKLQEETQKTGVHVALFYVKDMSHPYHRTKVDLNAQQLNITGGVVECENPQLSCVIAEGGPKAIKRYTRLMTVRMKWKGPDDANDEESDEEGEEELGEDGQPIIRHKFNAENKCGLVWTGLSTKRFFKGFVFQSCETSDQARTVLTGKGVGHYWDQVLTHASGRDDKFQLKLAESTDEEGGANKDEEGEGHGGGGGDDAVVKMEED